MISIELWWRADPAVPEVRGGTEHNTQQRTTEMGVQDLSHYNM